MAAAVEDMAVVEEDKVVAVEDKAAAGPVGGRILLQEEKDLN